VKALVRFKAALVGHWELANAASLGSSTLLVKVLLQTKPRCNVLAAFRTFHVKFHSGIVRNCCSLGPSDWTACDTDLEVLGDLTTVGVFFTQLDETVPNCKLGGSQPVADVI
jgi:hypothetical protein